jgi:uncharacterized protein
MSASARTSLAAVLLLAVCPSLARADGPSFDCRKGRTPAEIAICRDPVLAHDDLRIARRYGVLMKGLGAVQRVSLAADQAAFLRLRDTAADGSDPGMYASIRSILGERAAFLDRIRLAPPKGLIGTWGSLEGEVEIRPADRGRLRLYGNIADPYAARWTCEFDERGYVKSGVLGLQDGEEPIAFLDASRFGPFLEITQTDGKGQGVDSPSCGGWQSFANTYFYVGPVPDSEPEDR